MAWGCGQFVASTKALFRAACFGAFCICAATLVAAQREANVTQLWARHYTETTTNATDSTSHVVVDAAGDVIVSGYTDNGLTGQDILTIKYSGLNGSVIWQRRYNGPGNGNDLPNALALDRSGNVVVAGSSSWRGRSEFYTAKYASSDGALLWEHRDDGEESFENYARDVAVDSEGNVVVTGMSGMSFEVDFYTVKYAASDGTRLWSVRYNGPIGGPDRPASIALDRSGNVVVTGVSAGSDAYDYYTAKYRAADGALLWEQRYDAPQYSDEFPLAVAVDTDDNTIVTGVSVSSRVREWYTAKYGPDGALLWENHFAGLGTSGTWIMKPLAVDSHGDVFLVSLESRPYNMVKLAGTDGTVVWQRSLGSGYFTPVVTVDAADNIVVAGGWASGKEQGSYAARISGETGDLAWEQRSGRSHLYAVAVDRHDNAVVAGFLSDLPSNGDFYVAKYSSTEGEVIWEQQYDGPLVVNASATAVAIDDNGDVAVTGPVGKQDTYDYYTAKYSKNTGELLWEKHYDGPANSRDEPVALALDSRGNIIVSGTSWNKPLGGIATGPAGSGSDYYTVKYSAFNGAVLWEKRYNGPANGGDVLAALAVDAHDDVIVTGQSWNGTKSDFYTAKYSAADGGLLWERRTPSAANEEYVIRAMALDKRGNVIISAEPYNYVGDSDSCTFKYGAASGALLWRQQAGPLAGSDFHPRALAIDGSGNVLLTGFSHTGTNYYAYLVEYAAEAGTLLWEKRYNAAEHISTLANGVAVDHHGNIVITGSAESRSTDMNIVTAMFGGTDGALQWEQIYAGPGRGNDHGVALKIDKNGNIVIAGNSQNGNLESYIASYAADDGSLRWETRYRSPFNRDNYVSPSAGLAVGPDGMIAIAGTASGRDLAVIVYQESRSRPASK